MATGKKSKRVVEAEGIAHVSATFNNTLITITDPHGNAVSWGYQPFAGRFGISRLAPVGDYASLVAGWNVMTL